MLNFDWKWLLAELIAYASTTGYYKLKRVPHRPVLHSPMAAGGELQLVSRWVSPFTIRVKVALAVKKLSYEAIEEEVFSKSELVAKYNPIHGKIPILIHHGRPICESQIIIEYIDQVWPTATHPIMPADPLERATVRFWGQYIDDKLFSLMLRLLRSNEEAARAEALSEIVAALEVLEGAFTKNPSPFFGGDKFGFVDVVLGSVVAWFKALEKIDGVEVISGPRTSALAEWAERLYSVDEVRAVAPDADSVAPVISQIRARYSIRAASA